MLRPPVAFWTPGSTAEALFEILAKSVIAQPGVDGLKSSSTQTSAVAAVATQGTKKSIANKEMATDTIIRVGSDVLVFMSISHAS
jgi:hypothetical protein